MWKEILKRYIPALRHRPTVLRLHVLVDALLGIPVFLRERARRRCVAAPYLQKRQRRVVFVAEVPLRREPKFAYALKRAGWEVVLLHRQPLKFKNLNDFGEIHRYASPWHAVELAHAAKPQIVHVFANHFDTTTKCIVDHKWSPVVVDFYDIFEGIADASPEIQCSHALDIALQKYCITHADGVCCPDLQLQYNRRASGLARGKPTILFPNYCWDRDPMSERKSGEIHIVQSGWTHLETLGFSDIGCFQIVHELVTAGCHFHLYCHPSYRLDRRHFNDVFRDYITLGNETGRVHFHEPVPTDQLIEELSRFDYGLNMQNAASFGMEWRHENPRWLPLLASGRLFDYLDAGLGMLVDRILKFNWYLFRTSGALIDGTALLHSGQILDRLAERPNRERLLKARRALSVERQIHRLIAFYDAVSHGSHRTKFPKRVREEAV